MKLIAHRGNIDGPNSSYENSIEYIDNALKTNYDVEIDIWLKGDEFYLGHDHPQYQVSMDWLIGRKNNLWIHCKNIESLNFFSNSLINFNYFWHQKDDFTLTSQNYIWTYPGKLHTLKSIIVMPEWDIKLESFSNLHQLKCYGICSDYVVKI
jgi:hypothetical protein